ncbi:hypothetical protein ACOSP7_013853 [Xanthoceras sorbifolium]
MFPLLQILYLTTWAITIILVIETTIEVVTTVVVAIQAIEEGEVVEVAGMGTINLFVKSVLVLVTWRCSVIADTIALLLRVITTTMLVTILVQLFMGLCRFRLSRAISLVMPKAVVTIICRMAKLCLSGCSFQHADFASGPVSQSSHSYLVCNSSDVVSKNVCQSLALHASNASNSCSKSVVLPCKSFDVNVVSLLFNKTTKLWHSKLEL